MKISHKGPADAELPQLIKNEKRVSSARGDAEKTVASAGESTRVNISEAARKLQHVAELARAGDAMRAEKTNQLKQRIVKGEYRVEGEEVAKSILRGEVSRLLDRK